MSKPKIGFNWLASCGGCEEAVVDLEEDLLDVVNMANIVFWPCAMDFKKEDVEKMRDGEMEACFVNGSIRTSEEEEMAHLMRRKTQCLVAFGSCAHTGGVPGLGNFYPSRSILETAFFDTPSTVNPERVLPQCETEVKEGTLTLPRFMKTTRTLDQVVEVDYYLPGCPPPVRLIINAVHSIINQTLPVKGSVLAPDIAQCHECERQETKPETLDIKEFKRPSSTVIDNKKCLLAQGLLCLGPLTRSGCDYPCMKANMPCTGCLGPTSRVKDYGCKAMSSFSSLIDCNEEDEIDRRLDQIVDPHGTFFRYSLPKSFLHAIRVPNGNGKKGAPS